MKIVTCNGCFDGITPGHLFFFGYALAHGDAIVVGINSDDYIRRNKRPNPFFPEEKRIRALMQLPFIHDVVVFDEDGPMDFIRKVRPAVHCTGEEYKDGRCKEEPLCRELGIELVYVPRVGDWSSTLAAGRSEL